MSGNTLPCRGKITPEMAVMAEQLEEIAMPIIGTNTERAESE